jgi:hypothetical protein
MSAIIYTGLIFLFGALLCAIVFYMPLYLKT